MTGGIDLSTPAGVTLALLPELVLSACSLAVLLVVAWRHRTEEDSILAGWLSLGSLGVTGAALGYLWVGGYQAQGIPLMIALDGFRYVGSVLFLIAAAGTILFSLSYLPRERLLAPEFYPLLLFATSGMMYMAGAQDLIVLFLGLEIMSMSIYILAGFNRSNPASAEAALKYFLLGAFASGFLLYGIALVYGSTGTTNLPLIGAQLSDGVPLMASIGIGLLLIGFGFKVAAVPFHMWAPDVYDGSPTPVTAFMATGVKAAAFITLVRVLTESFPSAIQEWRQVVQVLAVASMVVGNLVALSQHSLKRMLAYSSIAHAGYLLVAVWTGTEFGATALLVYLFAYTLTSLGAFGLLGVLGRDGERDVKLPDIAGLGATRPGMAFALSVCMLSLLGFPGTLGFVGKWYIMSGAVEQHQPWLAVVLVLTSVVSAGYYLPVIMSIYMKSPRVPLAHHDSGLAPAARFAVVVSVAALLLFGVWPQAVLRAAAYGAGALIEVVKPVVAGN